MGSRQGPQAETLMVASTQHHGRLQYNAPLRNSISIQGQWCCAMTVLHLSPDGCSPDMGKCLGFVPD